MPPAYASKLDLQVYCTNFKAQKIDNSIFKIFGIILASFQVGNKLETTQVFQKNVFIS